jgi:hypothetical protein
MNPLCPHCGKEVVVVFYLPQEEVEAPSELVADKGEEGPPLDEYASQYGPPGFAQGKAWVERRRGK